nr:hypothetical protein [Mesorhizobium sp. B2-4-6]
MRQHRQIDLLQEKRMRRPRVLERRKQRARQAKHHIVVGPWRAGQRPVFRPPNVFNKGSQRSKGYPETHIVEGRKVLALPLVSQVGDCEIAAAVTAVENKFAIAPQPVSLEILQLYNDVERLAAGHRLCATEIVVLAEGAGYLDVVDGER